MALGTNRDYKTSERRAFKNLSQHARLMAELEAHGMSRNEASEQALAEMEGTGTRKDAVEWNPAALIDELNRIKWLLPVAERENLNVLLDKLSRIFNQSE